MPVQLSHVGCNHTNIYLKQVKYNLHEIKMLIDFFLVAGEFENSLSDPLERSDIIQVFRLRPSVQKLSPVMYRESFDSQTELEGRIGKGDSICATITFIEPDSALVDVMP